MNGVSSTIERLVQADALTTTGSFTGLTTTAISTNTDGFSPSLARICSTVAPWALRSGVNVMRSPSMEKRMGPCSPFFSPEMSSTSGTPSGSETTSPRSKTTLVPSSSISWIGTVPDLIGGSLTGVMTTESWVVASSTVRPSLRRVTSATHSPNHSSFNAWLTVMSRPSWPISIKK